MAGLYPTFDDERYARESMLLYYRPLGQCVPLLMGWTHNALVSICLRLSRPHVAESPPQSMSKRNAFVRPRSWTDLVGVGSIHTHIARLGFTRALSWAVFAEVTCRQHGRLVEQ